MEGGRAGYIRNLLTFAKICVYVPLYQRLTVLSQMCDRDYPFELYEFPKEARTRLVKQSLYISSGFGGRA